MVQDNKTCCNSAQGVQIAEAIGISDVAQLAVGATAHHRGVLCLLRQLMINPAASARTPEIFSSGRKAGGKQLRRML
jgi:hypothetical protein